MNRMVSIKDINEIQKRINVVSGAFNGDIVASDLEDCEVRFLLNVNKLNNKNIAHEIVRDAELRFGDAIAFDPEWAVFLANVTFDSLTEGEIDDVFDTLDIEWNEELYTYFSNMYYMFECNYNLVTRFFEEEKMVKWKKEVENV